MDATNVKIIKPVERAHGRPAGSQASESTTELKVTVSTAERIFRDSIKSERPLPSKVALQNLVDQLNRPWVPDYTHGPWDLMLAARIWLDDGPKLVAAEQRLRSAGARKRADAYCKILEGIQDALDAGVQIPQLGDAGPKTKQARGRANRHHRDWLAVFNSVRAALISAGWKRVGQSEISPAVKISCALLEQYRIYVSPEALAKLLKRKGALQLQKGDKFPP